MYLATGQATNPIDLPTDLQSSEIKMCQHKKKKKKKNRETAKKN